MNPRLAKQAERNRRQKANVREWLGNKRKLKQLRREANRIKGKRKKEKLRPCFLKRIDMVEEVFGSAPRRNRPRTLSIMDIEEIYSSYSGFF